MGLVYKFWHSIRHSELISGSIFKRKTTWWKEPKNIAILSASLFIAILGGIIFRNQIVTFFSSDPGANPVAYWKFDEGQGVTANNSISNSYSISTEPVVEDTNGGPINIDNASDFGTISGDDRHVVRTAAGVLYVFLTDSGSCEVWKSTDGTTWAEQDSGNNPDCDEAFGMAIDSTGNINIIYRKWRDEYIPPFTHIDHYELFWNTFSTASDTFASSEVILDNDSDYSSGTISIDSNDVPHISYRTGGGSANTIFYTNRVSGSWKTPVAVENLVYGFQSISLTINEDNIPEISYLSFTSPTDADLTAAVGNLNNATSFTLYDIDTTVNGTGNQRGTNIAIDSSGNTWIAYVDITTNYITIAKHNDADGWTTWQTAVTNSNVGYEPSIAINGTDIYVFYEDENDDIAYDMYNGSTWAGEAILQTGTYQDVRAKWRYLNNNQGNLQIDYLYSDNTDIYWASLGLSSSEPDGSPEWKSGENCISGTCLYFDGADSSTMSGTLPSIQTISFWMKPISTTNSIIDLTGSADIESTSGTLTSGMTSPTIYINGAETTTIEANKWSFVSVSSNTPVVGSTFTLGKVDSTYFTGFIDEVRIYDYARTSSQIKADLASRGSTKGVAAQFGDDDMSRRLSDGLVAYWNMDAGTGTTLTDLSGNNNIGNLKSGTAAPTWSTGKYGSGLDFDNTNDSVDVGFAGMNVFEVTNEITVSVWFKSDGIASLDEIISNTSNKFKIGISSGGSPYKIATSLAIGDGTTHNATGTTTLNNNTWYQGTMTYSNNSLKIYLNGQLEAETIISGDGAINVSAGSLTIGEGGTASRFWDGSIDEIRMYTRAFNPSEVKALYNYAPGPVAYWDMNEQSGTTLNDKSGNGFTGTITGAERVPGKYGSALKFNGDDYVDIASPSFPGIAGHITIGAWINGDPAIQPQNDSLFEGYGIGSTRALNAHVPFASSIVYWDAGPGTANYNRISKTAASADFEGNWNYWTFTKNVSTGSMKIYLNGSLWHSGNGNTAQIANLTSFRIGSYVDGTLNYDGLIDDFRIYNYERTPEQIVSDMNAGHPAPGSPVASAIAHYKLDEGYGTAINNSGSIGSTLNGIFGTGNSSPTWTNDGKFGKALTFDGTNDSINLLNPVSLQITGEMSISMWFKTSKAGATQYLIAKDTGTNRSYAIYFGASNLLEFYIFQSNSILRAGSVSGYNDGNWHHVVGSFDGTTGRLYVDGEQKGATFAASAIDNDPAIVRIGMRSDAAGDTGFQGSIDEIKIYSFALDSDQVKVEYNQGKAQVMGAGSTGVGGTSPSNSASREYCVPGDSSTCSVPVGEWRFDNIIGNTAPDSSTNGNNGALNNGPVKVNGKFGNALKFDGSNDYVSVPYSSSLGITTDITLSAWIKRANLTQKGIIIAKDNGSDYNFEFGIDNDGSTNDEIYFYSDAPGFFFDSSTSTISDTNWHHVAFTRSGSTTTFYLDGQASGVSTASGAFDNDTNTIIKIGGIDAPFNGTMDNVRIYNYARTPAQIAWEYNRGASIAHYQFNECTGTTVFNAARTGDNKPVGNNGTVTIGGSGSQTSVGTCQTSGAWDNGEEGKYGGSMSFDGVDDYINLGSSAHGLINQSSNSSYSFWINSNTNFDSQYETILRYDDCDQADGDGNCSASRPIFVVRLNWNVLEIFYGPANNNQAYLYGTTSLSLNRWYHVTVVKDSVNQELYLYLDGKLNASVVSESSVGNWETTGQSLLLGRYDSGSSPEYFMGSIDDLRIYNYALTPQQIKTEMTGAAVRFE